MLQRLGILGFGRFGAAMAGLLEEAGIEVRAWDPDTAKVPAKLAAASPADLVSSTDGIMVSVPVHATATAIDSIRDHLRPDQVVIDVGSVKMRPIEVLRERLGDRIPWVGTHPLFGPTSLALGERPLRVVLCPSPHKQAVLAARDIFTRVGCELILQTAEEHDQRMAETHALAFFVAKGMVDAGVPTDLPVAPPSFRALVRTIESVRSDAGHLFSVLHLENPFSSESRKRYLTALQAIDAELEARASEPRAATEVLMTIPDLGSRSPELKATRDLIDELDKELLTLLARRGQLAQRARHAKKQMGEGVRDRTREVKMLNARRHWANELGLEPAGVDAIFEAIMAHSRKLQENL